jgi:hypothetical protein
VSWEDNETRKDPKTIYLFLSTLRKKTKAKDNQGELNLTIYSSAAGACKATL